MNSFDHPRNFITQALIDAVTIAAWTVLGVLLLMAVLSPFMSK